MADAGLAGGAPVRRTLTVRGTAVEMATAGAGAPLLLLHGAGAAGRWLPFHDHLASRFQVHLPCHPGHGGSPAVEWIEHISDRTFHYLDLLDEMATELTFEDLEAGGYSMCGSPATVRDKLRIVSDELQAGIVCSGMHGGSHQETLEMRQLFAEEVMPHFREDAHVDETAGIGR